MVTVRITDGLGNQLFEYACAYAVARRRNDNITLDTSELDNQQRFDFALDDLNVTYDRRVSWSNKTILKKVLKKLRYITHYSWEQEKKSFQYQDSVFKNKSKRLYLYGYWQSYRYFKEYQNDIMKIFSLKKPLTLDAQRQRDIMLKEESCAVHIRRGCYAECGSVVTKDYFYEAFKMMTDRKEKVVFYFFSDDIEWVKREYIDYLEKNNYKYHFVTGSKQYTLMEEFFLMTFCKNQIISPSTFSWWGAYLNHNRDKLVIYPDHSHWSGDFWPQEWTAVKAVFEKDEEDDNKG